MTNQKNDALENPSDPDQDQKETYDLLISEEKEEKKEAEELDLDQELAPDHTYNTQHSDGHTYDPHVAQDQGLTYTPPSDPPVIASEEQRGSEIAAGFAPSMEESSLDVRSLPSDIAENDLNLLDNINLALRTNSEGGQADTIKVQVKDGVVNLIGAVPTENDIVHVYNIVESVPGVVEIRNNLQVAP